MDKTEWSKHALSDYFDINIGRTPPRKETEWFSTDSSNIPWVSISDMGSSMIYISETTEYLTKDAIDKFNIKIVPANTLILSFKLTLGRVSITDVELCTNEAIAHLNTDDTSLLELMYCTLKRYDYDSLGNTSSIGTAVNSKTIKSMPIQFPDKETVRKFHFHCKPKMEMIRTIERENKKLKSLRDLILPKLISGEIDISKSELGN